MSKKVKSFEEGSEVYLEREIQRFLDEIKKVKIISLSYSASPKTLSKDYYNDYKATDYKHFAILIYEEFEEEQDIIHG